MRGLLPTVFGSNMHIVMTYTVMAPLFTPGFDCCHTEVLQCKERPCKLRGKLQTVLPSIIMGNVRSLPGRLELAVLTKHQREYQECSIMLLMETWLTVITLAALDSFQIRLYGRTGQRTVRVREKDWHYL